MADVSHADELIATSNKLLSGTPSESDIRKAISASYFAAFHALAFMSANSLVGDTPETRPNRAWVEVYRGLSHGTCKDACAKAKSIGFPPEIEGFADVFVQLQVVRKRVDYDPTCVPTIEDAKRWVAIATVCIAKLNSAGTNSKIAFATWVLITSPGASQARTAVKEKIGPELAPPPA